MDQSIAHDPQQSARAAAALKAYDENEAWYRALPEAEQDGLNYEHYEDTILTVVHDLATALRGLSSDRATAAPSLAAPALSDATPCPACGVWSCADCGRRRQYASRFSTQPQRCGRCGSSDGQMLPVHHREGRAGDHREGYAAAIKDGLTLRYPLGS